MFINSLNNTFDQFEVQTRFPLKDFLTDFATFVSRQSKDITSFYNGNTKSPNIKSFNKLSELRERVRELESVIISNQDRFMTTDFWEVLEMVEDIKIKLDTIDNTSKWLRSVITKNSFNPNPETDYILTQQQTLEKVANNELSSQDPDTEWLNIALRNDLSEEDYTSAGGIKMKLSLQNSTSTLRLQTVVDNMQGEKIYGIDLDRNLHFVNNDLATLTPAKSIRQAVEILAGLRKGDNPEFPNDGLQSSLIVGSNLGSIAFPSVVRQMYETFQKDDTLKSFQITKIEQLQDAVFIEFEVNTRLSELLTQTITL